MLNLKEFVMWGLLVMAGLGITYAKGHSDATRSLTLTHQTEQLAAARQLEVERVNAQQALADISKEWQTYITTSKSTANRTLNDLSGRGIRLRVKLNDALVKCVQSDGGPLLDGGADLHPDTSRFLIEQAQRADAQVRGLQGAIRTLQGEPNDQTKGHR